jgi:elongation factor P
MAIRLEGETYKVIAADCHGGGGKMGGVTHAKLRNARTGAAREWRFRADEPIEEADLERQPMQFLYADDGLLYFMDPESCEQIAVEAESLGKAAAFLAAGMVVPLEFSAGRPIGMVFPDVVEARVAETAPPAHAQGTDNVWKRARLENGVEVMVPPFIAPGELIRVEIEAARYVDRAKGERRR